MSMRLAQKRVLRKAFAEFGRIIASCQNREEAVQKLAEHIRLRRIRNGYPAEPSQRKKGQA